MSLVLWAPTNSSDQILGILGLPFLVEDGNQMCDAPQISLDDVTSLEAARCVTWFLHDPWRITEVADSCRLTVSKPLQHWTGIVLQQVPLVAA